MKKLIACAMAVLAIFTAAVFTACSGKKDNAGPQDGRPTVMLITDATGIDDKSFNAAAWRGILEFYGDTWENQANRGTYYEVVTSQTPDMYIPNLKQASDEGYDLIITTGFTFADALGEVAPQYPGQKYMIVDVAGLAHPNIVEYVFSEEQGSYLVGIAAALQAQADGIANPRFGFIGGVPGETITKFEMGYIQGVLSILPNASIVDYYANDWGKPELAKTQAKNWYDSGVYAIFSAAGGTGNGTIAQAKEYRSQGRNVWAIGVDSDQYADGIYSGTKSAVLTSMIKRVEAASLSALEAIEAGNFKAGMITLDMAADGVGFSDANPELRPDVVAKVNQAKADIISGNITVIPSYAAALAAGKVPSGLGAMDN